MAIRRRLFARFYDTVSKGSEEAGLRDERRELLASAEGATLEVGAGTGLNLQHYPEAVTRLVLAEPDEHMRRRLMQRAEDVFPAAQIVDAGAERLPLGDATVDPAVVTFVLCSVPDQEPAPRELTSVLKPSGRLLFPEHVRSGEPGLAKWQDRDRRRYSLMGCNPNRDTLAALEASELAVGSVKHGEVPKSPKFERPLIGGSAR